jgi:hypothetical protein
MHLARIRIAELFSREVFCGAARYVAFSNAGSDIRSVVVFERCRERSAATNRYKYRRL